MKKFKKNRRLKGEKIKGFIFDFKKQKKWDFVLIFNLYMHNVKFRDKRV